jgi:hypothetical protein
MDVFSGESTWDREARRVALLAAEQGVVLEAGSLLLRDVRELRAIAERLQRARRRHSRQRWLARWSILGGARRQADGQWRALRM